MRGQHFLLMVPLTLCTIPVKTYKTGQVICSLLYGPHNIISVDNPKEKYTFSKVIYKNFSNTFKRHNSSKDEVFEYQCSTHDVVIKQPSRNIVTINAPKCASSKV